MGVGGAFDLTSIDEVDRKILEKLLVNSRESYRKIAEEIGVSEATVFFRVKKLVERGVIKGFTVELSPEHVGKGLTAFILIKAEPQKYIQALETVKGIEDIYEVFDVTGNYYAIAKVRTSDREKLAEIIDQVSMVDGISSTETLIVLRKIKEEFRVKF
ncbi:MAG: Lrp/AsnC family transcriptional regulator [Candidatus Bathyarchaeia archaeon]